MLPGAWGSSWPTVKEAPRNMTGGIRSCYGREKVQIDAKEVPYSCLKGAVKQDGKRLYQWTAIDEFSRYFVYGFEEYTPENSVKFLKLLEPRSRLR